MDIIEMARDLGRLIQKDERYLRLQLARANSDDDEVLQDMIGRFNLKRLDLNKEMKKDERDEEKTAALDAELKEIYAAVMSNPNMVEYNKAKKDIDEVLRHVNTIITLSAEGEDPDTADIGGCGSGCSSCKGCH